MKIRFLQEIIDIARGKVLYLDGMAKTFFVYKNIKDYNTLALGSSHVFLYMPDENGLNMGMASQDLYYSWELYKLLNKENPNIKNVIISYSVFTPGHCMIKTNENKVSVLYKVMYGIDYQYPHIARKKLLPLFEKHFKSTVDKYLETHNLDKTYRGGMPNDYFETCNINPEKAKEIALKHYKGNQRETEQLTYMKKILEATIEKNQNLLILLSPMSEEYRVNLPEKEKLFSKLYNLCSDYPKVKILDMYDSKDVVHEEFYDEHHLNLKGAVKITRFINKFLKENFIND